MGLEYFGFSVNSRDKSVDPFKCCEESGMAMHTVRSGLVAWLVIADSQLIGGQTRMIMSRHT